MWRMGRRCATNITKRSMANRRRKTSDQLQGRGSAYKNTETVVLTANAARKVPGAPKGLTPEARATWREFWRSPLASAVDYAGDGPALRRWIWLVSERDRLVARFYSQSEERLSLTTFGSTGNTVLHPLLRLEERLSREIMMYEDRFGMTPLARMRLGVAIGQAHESLDGMRKRLADAPAGAATVEPGEDGVIDLDGLA